jgi:hypothetical protein
MRAGKLAGNVVECKVLTMANKQSARASLLSHPYGRIVCACNTVASCDQKLGYRKNALAFLMLHLIVIDNGPEA